MKEIIVMALDRTNKLTAIILEWLISLLARFAIASTFWLSVQTKISGWELFGQSWQFWNLSASTFMLFENEYMVPLLPVNLAAYMTTFCEFFLSIAIVFGFLTRLSAIGLLCITVVIQFFVYPDAWSVHIFWAATLLYLIRYGAGNLSIDYFLRKK